MIEKSDGNFLSLKENIGVLLHTKKNFENGDHTHPLTDLAMKRIEKVGIRPGQTSAIALRGSRR